MSRLNAVLIGAGKKVRVGGLLTNLGLSGCAEVKGGMLQLKLLERQSGALGRCLVDGKRVSGDATVSFVNGATVDLSIEGSASRPVTVAYLHGSLHFI